MTTARALLVCLLLAGSVAVRAQPRPSRFLTVAPNSSPQPAPQSLSSSSCARAASPAGATALQPGTGSIPAPRGGQASYARLALNLANYAVGGVLTIQIAVGNGAAIFELFPGNTVFPTNGTPSTQPLTQSASISRSEE